MSRIALRIGAVTSIFAAGIGASLALTPQGQSRPIDCVVGICVPTATVPPVPVPVPLPVPTETTSTTTSHPATPPPPAQSNTPTTAPTGPVDDAPSAQPGSTLTTVRVSVTGRGAKRVLAVTLTLARPAGAALHFGLRPRAVRATSKLGAGRHVRKLKIPARTRAGRYLLTLTVRSAEAQPQTHRRTISVSR